jgi:tetratricopeptide (TPR) repeat protein
MAVNNPSNGPTRLDSWKEIAAFLGRDERTVSRWEKELGLPVHRLPGTKGRVYAYSEELSAWLAKPKRAHAALLEFDFAEQPGAHTSGLSIVYGRRATDQTAPRQSPPEEKVIPSPSWRHANAMGLLAAAIVIIAAVGLVLFQLSGSRDAKTAERVSGPSPQPSARDAVNSPRSYDPEAEQFYLKGRYYWDKRTPEDLNKALDYFMQAVVHDPNYAPAYVGMADCYNLLREFTLMPPSEAYPRALAAAKKAVELDDQSSEAHASLAFVSFFGMWDVTTGEREFRRAIALNPKNPAPHQWYANALMALDRLPEALEEIARAQALDPASIAILADRANILGVSGRREEALSLLQQLENRDPAFRSLHLYLKYIYLRNQDYPNFLAESRRDALLVHDDSALAVTAAAEKGFAQGGARGMLEATLRVQQKLYARNALPPTALAQTFALLGNKQEALRYLEAAYTQKDSSLIFIEAEPEFNTLHDEPAYRDLLARMNLPLQNVR